MRRKKKNSFILLLFILLAGIGIGYALLTQNFNIIGSSTVASSTWDIHFDNLQVTEGSVSLEEGDSAASIDQTTHTDINYAVTLSLPGDFYEFTVDVVNAGTIDGMVSVVTSKLNDVVIDNEHPVPDYLIYSVKYDDDIEIEESHLLAVGETETYKVRVEFDSEITGDNLPSDTQTLNFNFGVTYVQADDTAQPVPHPSTLYGVLEDAANEGTYATKYTGDHQDSYAGTGNKDIYHWYAINDPTNALATEILDKNNVVFAGHCWQILRTTDTGGVKLIYNGEAENNQCLNTRGNHVGYGGNRTTQNLASNYYYGTSYNYDSTNNVFSLFGTLTQETWNETTGPTLVGKYTCKQTTESGTCATLYLVESYYNTSSGYVIPLNSNSHYSQFGTLQYNANYDSPSYAGYMYNAAYSYHALSTTSENILSTNSLSTSYWYAHNAVWGSPITYRYNLDNPYQVSSTTDYPNLVGEYTFRSSTQTNTNTNVYYIAAVNNTTMYYIQLDNTANHTLEDVNYTYTYGDSYTDNGNGTYTINNPTTIYRSDWYTGYSNVKNKYVCKNATNNTCSELRYTTTSYATSITYIKVADVYKYAKGFTWDGNKYVLDNDTSVSFWNISDSANQTSLNNAHYTCWNTTGECTSISYVYSLLSGVRYYINLSNGESIEDAMNKMLYSNDVNTINSTIKTGVDAWYAKYLSNYDSYIEDTIFCNNRSQTNADTNGWNPNGGVITGNNDFLNFKEYDTTSDLSCTNETDQFSTLNSKAQLIYKVGLISSPEVKLLSNVKACATGMDYWLFSPHFFNQNRPAVRRMSSLGILGNYIVQASHGVRPAISLKPGTTYTSGDGSMASPYIVN